MKTVNRGQAKHTPGPWTKEFGKHTPGHASTMRFVSPDNTHAVCDVFWYNNGNANANVIGAAPTMLEILEQVEARMDKYDEEDAPELCEAIRQVIAQARGLK